MDPGPIKKFIINQFKKPVKAKKPAIKKIRVKFDRKKKRVKL
jgi:hypothetical protein